MTNRTRLLQRFAALQTIALLGLAGSWSAGFSQTQQTKKELHQVHSSESKALKIAFQVPADELSRLAPTTPKSDSYILGPGDAVLVELLDVPEYSGVFSIGPDGSIYYRGFGPLWWRA